VEWILVKYSTREYPDKQGIIIRTLFHEPKTKTEFPSQPHYFLIPLETHFRTTGDVLARNVFKLILREM